MESIEKIIAEGLSHSPIEMAGEIASPAVSTTSSNPNWYKVALALIVVSICSGIIYYAVNLKENTATLVENEDNSKQEKEYLTG